MKRAHGILFPPVFNRLWVLRLGSPEEASFLWTASLGCYRVVLYSAMRRYHHHHRADGTDAKLFPGFPSFNNSHTEQATKTTKLMSASDCRGEAELLEVLRSLDLDLPTISHEAKYTVVEADKELSRFGTPCTGTKNMFLRSKKNELILVTALPSTKTHMKKIQNAIGSKELRFAPEEVLRETLGVVQGSVTPFALINTKSKDIKLILDKALMESTIPFVLHPCRNDKSTLVTPKQLCQFLDRIGYPFTIVDFSEDDASTDATGTDPASGEVMAKPGNNKSTRGKEKKSPTGDIPSTDVPVDSGETKLRIIAKRSKNFSQWYVEVISKAEMIEYYDISGCYIMRPWSFFIWSRIQKFLGPRLEKMGVEDCYFPMFLSKACLEREKEHVEGFAPEVAWVTRAGETDLEVPVAIRPTSETVMYPYYAKWIRSHRDLPLRLNMWNNVIRWEFSHPTPFIRTREFLWQEGHCAWQTEEQCSEEVLQILDNYAAVYEELLAVPVVKGKKTEKERFPGGYYTTTVETYIAPVGRGCQGATSHNLGQGFGKIFDISFQDPDKNDGSTLIPWQNSWGLSTRVIGVMTMVHGDDRGLILPPRVASVQVVIIPVGITKNITQEEREEILDKCKALEKELVNCDVRAKADLRDNYSPGWRFNHWEVKGVPVRIELGPKELSSRQFSLALRYNSSRRVVPWDEQLSSTLLALMDEIHNAMLERASREREENTKKLTEWKDFTPALNNKCVVLAPWCGSMACEDQIKMDSAEESKAMQSGDTRDDARSPSMGAKSLCIPFQQPEGVEGRICICKSCNKQAKEWVLFGRSY